MNWENTTSKEYLEGDDATIEEYLDGLIANIDVAARDIEILTTGHAVLQSIVEKSDDNVNEVFDYYGTILAGVRFNDAEDMLSRAGTTVEGVFSAIGNAIQRAWEAIINFFKRLFGFATSAKQNKTIAKSEDLLEELGTSLHNNDTIEWKVKQDWKEEDFKVVHTDIGDDMVKHIRSQYDDLHKVLSINTPIWEFTRNGIRKGAPKDLSNYISKMGDDNVLTHELRGEIMDSYQTVALRKGITISAGKAVEKLMDMIEAMHKHNTALASLNLKIGQIRFDKIIDKGSIDPHSIDKDDGRVILVDRSIKNVSDPLAYIRTYANLTKAYVIISTSTIRHYTAFVHANIKCTPLKNKKK